MGINNVVLRMSGLRISDVIQGRSTLTIIWIYKGRDRINILLLRKLDVVRISDVMRNLTIDVVAATINLIELPINEERLIRNDWCERAMEGTMSLNQQEIIVEKKNKRGR